MTHQPTPGERERPEPEEADGTIPWYIEFLVLIAIAWGAIYITTLPFERQFEAPGSTSAVDGKLVFTSHCAACHQDSGLGIPGAFPPLAGSEWVIGPAEILVRILLHGVSGEIHVAGQTFNGQMPAFGEQLGDEELAAVASYIRGAWQNRAGPVSRDLIVDQRQAHGDRAGPWHGENELRAKLEEQ